MQADNGMEIITIGLSNSFTFAEFISQDMKCDHTEGINAKVIDTANRT